MMFHFVLLAAGLSTRYGRAGENKLLADIDGKPMYRHILDRLCRILQSRSDVLQLVVVTRENSLYEEISGLAQVSCVKNPYSEQGIASSVLLGQQKLEENLEKKIHLGKERKQEEGNCHGAVYFVADQPYLKTQAILDFLDGYRQSGKGLGCMKRKEMLGNPCIFDQRYWKKLKEIQGDQGGKQVLRRYPQDVYYHELAEERQLLDIDVKEELSF